MTPRILISGCDESRFDYENAVAQCGGEPVSFYLPPLDGSFDGLLLAGGNDIAPWRYGQENTDSVDLDEKRDQAEFDLLKLYVEQKKPVLGICRGMQLLNAFLGGDLRQDIGQAMHLFHSKWDGPLYRVHPVAAAEGSILKNAYGETFMVNSVHHQALNRIAPGLRPAAWSESGIVEAVEHETLPILGVQFHPEKMSFLKRRPDTVDGEPIFRWFLEAAGQK